MIMARKNTCRTGCQLDQTLSPIAWRISTALSTETPPGKYDKKIGSQQTKRIPEKINHCFRRFFCSRAFVLDGVKAFLSIVPRKATKPARQIPNKAPKGTRSRGLKKPNDEAALNLRARLEMLSGDNAKAQDTLYQCIISNPQSYYAYYNMARIILAVNGKKGRKTAGEYYKMGREMGGPTDEVIEEGLK